MILELTRTVIEYYKRKKAALYVVQKRWSWLLSVYSKMNQNKMNKKNKTKNWRVNKDVFVINVQNIFECFSVV